jgi:hypothetical protein
MSEEKKQIRWLERSEAKKLGLELKKSELGRKNARYSITAEEWELVQRMRIEPRERAFLETQRKLDKNGRVTSSVEKLQSEPIPVPDGWLPSQISMNQTSGQQWVRYAPPKIGDLQSYITLRDAIIEEMKVYSPEYPKITYKKTGESHCLVFDPSDIHIGKIASSFEAGEEYNNQIAVQRVMDGLYGILSKAKGFKFDKIIFVAGNDILHVDGPTNTTTSGTRQDVTGMWYDSFLMAKTLLVEIIETLMQIAPVEVVFNPSNHDYISGFFLLDSISSWFRLSKNVTFDCDMSHRKYTQYHDNLIATTHMDGAKMDLLPLLAAQESKMWDITKHRYIYGHHIHHKIAKDYVGITLETLRSPSGADSWHHRKGYQHAPVAVEAFIHHKTQGQVCRITHNF